MPPRRERLSDLVIKEVSLVQEGDNPPARIKLWKRRETWRERVSALVAKIRSGAGADVEKKLFDEIRAARNHDQVFSALYNRLDDLTDSIRSILFWEGEDVEGTPEERIRRTLDQFTASVDADLPEIFAGRIVKALAGATADPGRDAIRKQLAEALEFEDPAAAGKGGKTMDLTKLSAEDRATVEKALAGAARVADLEAQIAKAKAGGDRVAELEAEIRKLKGESDPDPLAALPAEIRKSVEPILKATNAALEATRSELEKSRTHSAELEKKVTELRTQTAKDAFAKTVGDTLEGLAESREALIDQLWAVPEGAARDGMLKTLQSAATAARNGALFEEIGLTGTGDNASGSMAKIHAAALEIRKARPSLTIEQARVEAMRENPALYREATSGAH